MPGSSKSQPLSQRSFVEELPQIIHDRGLTTRRLALKAGVTPSHLSRVLRQTDYKSPSADLCRRVALALELPEDYWPEYRERKVIDEIRANPKLRDQLYQRRQLGRH